MRYARQEEQEAVALAEDMALLVRWLREDILAVSGPAHAVRGLYSGEGRQGHAV